MDRIAINAAQLRSSGRELDSLGQRIQSSSRRMRACGNSVANVWSGADAEAFRQQLSNFLDESDNYATFVQNLGLSISKCATDYNQARDSVISRAGR